MEKYQMIKEILNELVYVPSEHPDGDAGSPKKNNPIRPRSYEDFRERVKTYLNGNWTAKPVNPLICSQYGWKCVDKDLLQCTSCRSMVVGSLPSVSTYYLYVECCDKLLRNIKSGHKTLCPWANLPSPSSFTKVSILEAPHMEDYLLKQLKCLVPVVKCYHEAFTFTSAVKEEDLIPVLDTLKLAHDQFHILSLTLIIMGWELDGTSNSLKCNYCHRALPLKSWLAHRKSANNGGTGDPNEKEPFKECVPEDCPSPDTVSGSHVICNTSNKGTDNAEVNVTNPADVTADEAVPSADTDYHEHSKENEAVNIHKRKPGEQEEDCEIKRFRINTSEDICDQHQYWCPWIDSDSPGWRQFLTAVSQLTFTKHNTSLLEHPDYANKVRGILKIRSLMEEW